MYKFWHDPGHGWLEVPYKELVELGIEKDISAFSHINLRNGHLENEHGEGPMLKVYLEEDRDMGVFIKSKWGKDPVPEFEEIYHTGDKIRGLYDYNLNALEKWRDSIDRRLHG
jgi:hypothetical protein